MKRPYIFIAVVTLLLFCLFSSACTTSNEVSVSPGATHQNTSAPFTVPTPTFAPTYSTVAPMGHPPISCSVPLTRVIDVQNSGAANAVGSNNVFGLGFGRPQALVYLDFQDKYGWGQKLLWLVGPEHQGPIVLRGRNLQTQQPVSFAIAEDAPTSPGLLIQGRGEHGASFKGPGWHEWGSYIYVPSAGCYELTASWNGGSWQAVFVAGR